MHEAECTHKRRTVNKLSTGRIKQRKHLLIAADLTVVVLQEASGSFSFVCCGCDAAALLLLHSYLRPHSLPRVHDCRWGREHGRSLLGTTATQTKCHPHSLMTERHTSGHRKQTAMNKTVTWEQRKQTQCLQLCVMKHQNITAPPARTQTHAHTHTHTHTHTYTHTHTHIHTHSRMKYEIMKVWMEALRRRSSPSARSHNSNRNLITVLFVQHRQTTHSFSDFPH